MLTRQRLLVEGRSAALTKTHLLFAFDLGLVSGSLSDLATGGDRFESSGVLSRQMF